MSTPHHIPHFERLRPLHDECIDLFVRYLVAQHEHEEHEATEAAFQHKGDELESEFERMYHLFGIPDVTYAACANGRYDRRMHIRFRMNELSVKTQIVMEYDDIHKHDYIKLVPEGESVNIAYAGIRGKAGKLITEREAQLEYLGITMYGFTAPNPTLPSPYNTMPRLIEIPMGHMEIVGFQPQSN